MNEKNEPLIKDAKVRRSIITVCESGTYIRGKLITKELFEERLKQFFGEGSKVSDTTERGK